MRDDIERVMRDLVHGITPSLPLPEIYEDEADTTTAQKPREEEKKKKVEADRPPGWWSRNPDLNPEWEPPEDKSMKDLFTNLSPTGKQNVARFPKIKHHDPKVSEQRPMCVKYQCQGRCRVGCALEHIRPSNMGRDTRTKVDSAFKQAYA